MMTDLHGTGSPGRRPGRAAAAGFVVALAGSAVLGLPAGLIWDEAAPRARLREISAGTAEFVNAETRAFIGADAWFCGIAAIAGLLTGVIGYRLLVRRYEPGRRAAATGGLVLGAVAGSFVMLWLGERVGLSGYDHELASSPKGTMFHASLALGAKSALVFWPLLTSVVILVAEWGTRREADSAPVGGDGLSAPAE
ncbi:MAG TPA: hypothetical protein VH372_13170 [Actinospica sp.]|nr:hypothetical protein [Actinospica sp.]